MIVYGILVSYAVDMQLIVPCVYGIGLGREIYQMLTNGKYSSQFLVGCKEGQEEREG